MFQCVFCSDSIVVVIDQQFMEDVPEIVRTSRRQKLLDANALLLREVYLHMRGLTPETVKDLLFGSAKDVVNPVDLVHLVLSRE